VKKSDIERCYHDHWRDTAHVNVKVHNLVSTEACAEIRAEQPDHEPPFTWEWVEEHISESAMDHYWQIACEIGWEDIEVDAQEIWGDHVTVYSEGRQGGWAHVKGLSDVESWDAVDVAKWAKFSRWAKGHAKEVPYRILELIYLNTFQQWIADEMEEAGIHRDPIPA